VEINRNQYFLMGLVLLLLGIQFRLVDTYVLNEETTRILVERMGKPPLVARSSSLLPAVGPNRRVVQPPEWLGWALMSIGSVLILHSLALKRPD